MKLSTSYKQILSLSVPIMLGSAAQNIIVLSDNVFLYHYDSIDFAAAGLVGVFYLIIASIGYGFSRGGQIIIARRNGEHNYVEQVPISRHCLFSNWHYLLFYFYFCSFLARISFSYSSKTLKSCKCMEYIIPRSYGVFFSYLGVALISFYTGIVNTKFIIYDTIVLIVVNLVLNYVLVFGKFGVLNSWVSPARPGIRLQQKW